MTSMSVLAVPEFRGVLVCKLLLLGYRKDYMASDRVVTLRDLMTKFSDKKQLNKEIRKFHDELECVTGIERSENVEPSEQSESESESSSGSSGEGFLCDSLVS